MEKVHPTPSTANALYRKLKTNIPRKETARPRSQFLHSCICERLYIPTISPQTQYSKIGGQIVGRNKSLTDTRMQTLGRRPCSFTSGNIVSNFRCRVLPPPTYEERNIWNICKSKWSKNTALCCIYRKIFD